MKISSPDEKLQSTGIPQVKKSIRALVQQTSEHSPCLHFPNRSGLQGQELSIKDFSALPKKENKNIKEASQ